MNEAAKQAAKFLKSTLRLPTSTFPPRPLPSDLQRYRLRCTDDLYAWQHQSRPDTATFVLHDGPPYANGDPHVGHALNKIVKDIITRTKLANGARVHYVPGWDCHGLPIELKALEKHGWKRGHGIDAVAIRKAARSFAHNTVKKQMQEFKSWGVMGDWDNHWKTMDKAFELRQLQVFKAMAEHGLIYRKHKPVFWSPSSGTALAEAEVEYKEDFVSVSAIVKFPTTITIDGIDEAIHVVIWTTTPWTLPANQAIAINDGIQYILVRSHSHGLLVVARSRLQYLEEQIHEHLAVVIDSLSVSKIAGTTYSGLVEFGEEALNRPIIHADFVTDSSGTGLVHCAPGHGQDDFEALQPLIDVGHVSVKAPVDDHGCFTTMATPNDPALLNGLYVYDEGSRKVLDLVSQNGNLVASFDFKHKYPIDWRTKEPVMIRATAQWFADVSSIREATMASLEDVDFKPKAGRSRLASFVLNRSEWCISRQRAWGVPIPALYHRESGAAVLTTESINHIISVIHERGIDAWWSDADDEPCWMPHGLSAQEHVRGTDTMDVWFDSGTSWTFMSGDDTGLHTPPADVYLEGSDQHRGWFQSSLLTRIAYQRATLPDRPATAPFRTLVTHGFTLDANERKMSKSEGNVIAPSEIMAGLVSSSRAAQPKPSKKFRETHPLGPDVLRLWAASSDWTKDVVISEKVVTSVHNNLDKWRVTIKLLLGMLHDFDPGTSINYEEMNILDRIALLQLYNITQTVRGHFEDFEFHKAVNSINRWIASDLSGFYFEAVKDIIYCDAISSLRRRSAQTTIYHILQHMQHMTGPITPLLVEESFVHSPVGIRADANHPHRKVWSHSPEQWKNADLENAIPVIMAVNSAVKVAQEKARAAKVLGQSLGSEVLIHLHDDLRLPDAVSESMLMEMLVVSAVRIFSTRNAISEVEKRGASIKEDSTITNHQRDTSITGNDSVHQSWAFEQKIELSNVGRAGLVVVRNPSHTKCSRCWKYTVPQHCSNHVEQDHIPSLCQRCESVVQQYIREDQKPEVAQAML